MAATQLESLKKSIGKKKAKSQAFAWLADLERESGDLDTSLQRVDGGLTMYPSDVPAMLVRSMILFQKGDFEGCIAECEKVLKFDPFCLSAQKRMGDAYEQLGNENERNKCYRRVHDMDPLDTFWKEEYENVVEEAAAAAGVAAAAGLEMNDVDFSMPDVGTSAEASPAVEGAESAPAEVGENAEPAAEGELNLTPTDNAPAEDDPFAALSALLPNVDSGEEAAMDSLQASLDTAMAEMAKDEPSAPEVFPADDEVSGSDVGSALSNMFGVEDDVEPEAPASPFAKLDLPVSLDDEPAPAEAAPVQNEQVSESIEEDKPQSVDNAFDSIFGEDELPEEKPQSVDSAFDSIFGEDELPEEKPQSVDSAFDSIFGEDELPEEKPQGEVEQKLAEEPAPEESSSMFEKSATEDSLFDKSADADPSIEESSSMFDKSADADGLFEKSADLDMELSAETPAEDAAVQEETVEEPSAEDSLPEESLQVTGNDFFDDSAEETAPAEPVAEEPAPADEDRAISVDSALDALFGSDDDDLPEEKPAESATPVEEEPKESLVEQVTSAEDELEMPTAETAKDEAKEFEKEMGGAFASIFGEDDDDLDLPEAKKESANEVPAPSQEDTGAVLEEAPATDASLEADLDKSFNSLFGEESAADETPAENVAEAPAAPVAEVPAAVETESLENEIDGAFKGLFQTDDDSLPEEKTENNKGVDFLMSGDSDDEVSSGLIKDPSAPLERGAADLDESLNTKTLAEIYFEQGLYGKALDIYEDLARKEPDNAEIASRLQEIEKAYREKFGDNANG